MSRPLIVIPDTPKFTADKIRWRARDLHRELDPSDLLEGRTPEFIQAVALELNGMVNNCRSPLFLIRLREAFVLVNER